MFCLLSKKEERLIFANRRSLFYASDACRGKAKGRRTRRISEYAKLLRFQQKFRRNRQLLPPSPLLPVDSAAILWYTWSWRRWTGASSKSRGGCPPAFFFSGVLLREISVFVDESGGQDGQSRYYALTLVFHDQARPIDEMIARHKVGLRDRGARGHAVSCGPYPQRAQGV